jgi:hypothetical protein
MIYKSIEIKHKLTHFPRCHSSSTHSFTATKASKELPTMAPLKPGDTVFSKSKPHRKGTIVAAVTAGRKHEWAVQFEGDDAVGGNRTMRSQQLLCQNPDVDDSTVAPSSNAHLQTSHSRRQDAAAAAVTTAATPTPPPPLEETDEDDTEELEEDLEALQLEEYGDPFTSDEESELEQEVGSTLTPPEDYIPAPPGAIVDSLGEPVEEDVYTHGEVDLEPEDVHKAKQMGAIRS